MREELGAPVMVPPRPSMVKRFSIHREPRRESQNHVKGHHHGAHAVEWEGYVDNAEPQRPPADRASAREQQIESRRPDAMKESAVCINHRICRDAARAHGAKRVQIRAGSDGVIASTRNQRFRDHNGATLAIAKPTQAGKDAGEMPSAITPVGAPPSLAGQRQAYGAGQALEVVERGARIQHERREEADYRREIHRAQRVGSSMSKPKAR